MKTYYQVLLAAGMSILASNAYAAGPKICISTFDLANPYWVNLVNGAKERAKEVGAEIVVNDPANDASKQIAAIENFATVGCKAVIVAALDPASMEGSAADAQKAGMKFIAQSMEVKGADVWASADERDMGFTIGTEAGNWIKDKLAGKGKVLLLNDDRVPQMIARKDGMKEAIMKLAPESQIVGDQPSKGTSDGMTVTESVLQAHPDVNVIVAINDASALGALAAVESSGVDASKIFIGGIDATPEAREKISGKTAFRASVDNVPFQNGKDDVDLAMKLIAGEKIEYRQVVKVKAFTGK